MADATRKVNGFSPRYTQDGAVFLPVAVGPDDATPGDVLSWIRSLAPQHDGRIYIRVSDVRTTFGAAELFYHVIATMFREGMVKAERWRLEKLGPGKPKPWSQIDLVYVVEPIDLARPVVFECYVKQRTKPKPLTKEERLEIWTAYGGMCAYCGNPVAVEAMAPDHDIPRSRGGSDDLHNLVCSCHPCNTAKHARTGAEYLRLVTERGEA